LFFFTDARDLLLCIDEHYGSTFLHKAAESRSATGIRSVLYEVGLDTEIIKQIISVKDKYGTVLHRAAYNEDGVLLELLRFIIENFENPEGE
jgi:hypothetical protein